jgi:hypothetical protein
MSWPLTMSKRVSGASEDLLLFGAIQFSFVRATISQPDGLTDLALIEHPKSYAI